MKMFAYKSMILRLLESYEKSPNSVHGRLNFFKAVGFAIVYKSMFLKKGSVSVISFRNWLFNAWRKNPEKYELDLQKQINQDYVLVNNVLDKIKVDDYKPIVDYDVNRKKVKGCIGVVVY